LVSRGNFFEQDIFHKVRIYCFLWFFCGEMYTFALQ
jgi:hypothetical protein